VAAMAERPGMTVRRRRLSGELRRLRQRSELTGEKVADRFGWSVAKVSRVETGRTGISQKDLRDLLDLYGVKGEKREALLSLARESRKKGWWDAYADSLPTEYATYISLESEAGSIHSFCPQVVPGLLQTEDYARSVIRSAMLNSSPPEVAGLVEARMERQGILTRLDPLQLWVIIDEAVLHRQVGGPEVMSGQYERLIECAEQPNITIQVLPFAAGSHTATACAFAILIFREKYDPDVVYVETMTSSLYVEKEMELYRYTLAFDHLRAVALGPDDSVAKISGMAARL
jgi:transcriptional regulator with XRE-family HTH domain